VSNAVTLPMSRVRSRDGTKIAYWTSGLGSPLVVVHGAAADHTRWRPLLPYLEAHFTIHAMDRRGRGASGDSPPYGVIRECEDVAAVVDAVAESSGSPVDVYGHSHGGFCAFGAATLSPNIRRLALYEGWPVRHPGVFALPTEVEQRMEALLTPEIAMPSSRRSSATTNSYQMRTWPPSRRLRPGRAELAQHTSWRSTHDHA
jgi:pimeloyl-ACP methyl ester carboxylesterase